MDRNGELQRRMLGERGPAVTSLGLGLAALGRPGYINLARAEDLGADRSPAAMQQRTHELLDAARAAGVRYFDMARSYGESELFMSRWLEFREIAPGELTIGSKWGYTYTAGWVVDADPPEVKDLSAENLRRQLEQTRALLGAHLSLYQIHSATIESGVLEDAKVAEELAALRADGVAVGLSTSGRSQAATIEQALAVGGFDTVQATWNLLETSAGESLAHAHAAGLGVIVKEPLANGRLGPRGAPRAALSRLSDELGLAPVEIALAAALAQPWADVVLSGAVTVEQLAGNLAAARLQWSEQLSHAVAPLALAPDEYWAERSALAWN